jgi:hypothetical protein
MALAYLCLYSKGDWRLQTLNVFAVTGINLFIKLILVLLWRTMYGASSDAPIQCFGTPTCA